MTEMQAGLDTQKAAAAYQVLFEAALASEGPSARVPLPVASDDVETIGRVRADKITDQLEVPVNPSWVDGIEVSEFVSAILSEYNQYRVSAERRLTIPHPTAPTRGFYRETSRRISGS